jgi:hypothetical protein
LKHILWKSCEGLAASFACAMQMIDGATLRARLPASG